MDGPTGNVLEFFTSTFSEFGDAVRIPTQFQQTAHLISNPAYLKRIARSSNYEHSSLLKIALGNGLLTSKPETWKSQRRLMQPYFRSGSVRNFATIITNETNRYLQELSARDPMRAVAVNKNMVKLTLNVISQVSVSLNMHEKNPHFTEDLLTIMNHLARLLNIFSPSVLKPTEQREFSTALKNIRSTVAEIIDDRRAGRVPAKNDLLEILIRAHEKTGSPGDQLIEDELVTILISGHETTSVMLCWALYLIAKHPDVEAKFHHELDSVLQAGPVTVSNFELLKFTKQILYESLRLYPPVWHVTRKAINDDRFGEHEVKAGDLVIANIYLAQRHPGFWHEPDQFQPERFGDEGMLKARDRMFSFWDGAHSCLGMHLSILEGVFILASLGRSYRFKLAHNQEIKPEPSMSLRCPLSMHIVPRQ